MDSSELSCRALHNKVGGNNVSDFTKLDNFRCREHRLSNSFSELHQHLVDVRLPDPRELDKGPGYVIQDASGAPH